MLNKRTNNSLDAFCMPFTPNRAAKADPMLLVSADGAYYVSAAGDRKFDAVSGLWCCNAGHNRRKIIDAVKLQLDTLDYAPSFLFGHPGAFSFAQRLASLAPPELDHVFFTNSGSEAVDTALKLALAYQTAAGEPRRTMLVGRDRAFHGAGFGGIAVGGIKANRLAFQNQLPRVAHLRHTSIPENRFSPGEPEHGAELADDLIRIIELHGAETVAAVIVEPMAGSSGVFPAPKGYLKRLRELCTRYNILLIFDEVITAFGRLGHTFAAERFGVEPDMICFAKGVSSGVAPLGGVMFSNRIHDTIMQGPEQLIELFHGYTYSGHPIAMAAGDAALSLYEKEGLFKQSRMLEARFTQLLMGLRELPNVIDLRCIGLAAAIELAPREGSPTIRAREAFLKAFREENIVLRYTGDNIILAPPLISTDEQLCDLFNGIERVLVSLD
ncbi:MAG: aminotransferase class III-fold pyridoxal phosphate-dependent enzyme [Rhizobiaceae bacterium]|nr:aminotransferase class III-fold pyridoxal phosphate-dependent enzyme [Rhizobiaceae bacterium]